MKTIKICNRWTGATLFETQVADDDAYPTRTALEKAVLRGANLARAYLAGANLARAYLADANLSDANLSGAYLAGANLARAYLAGANLGDANLSDANLSDANLSDANLSGANLSDAYLDSKSFRAAVPLVRNLDAKILAAIETGGALAMGSWHSCETTHCRAGWAITLAGEKGKELERRHGSATAGALIYWRSTGNVPNFYASDEEALADIIACASEQGAAV